MKDVIAYHFEVFLLLVGTVYEQMPQKVVLGMGRVTREILQERKDSEGIGKPCSNEKSIRKKSPAF
jgi:hypothetical protein